METNDECAFIRTRRNTFQACRMEIVKPGVKPDRLNGEYSYKNKIKQRVMEEPCMNCKMKCDSRVAERVRVDNYLKFWAKLKSWEERRLHLRKLVQLYRVSQLKVKTRKKFMRKYLLEIEDGVTLVCKTMFFNTLAISAKFMETTLKMYPRNIADDMKLKYLYSPPVVPLPPRGNMYKPKKLVLKRKLGYKYIRAESEKLSTFPNKTLPNNNVLLQQSCSCNTCNISQEERIRIFNKFWKLPSWNDRRLFVLKTISVKNERIEQRDVLTRIYELPTKNDTYLPVCQAMYLSTLAINEKVIQSLLLNCLPVENETNLANTNATKFTNHIPISNINDLMPQIQHAKEFLCKCEHTKHVLSTCSCPLRCSEKVIENDCQQIHREFWNLSNHVDRKHFVLSTIQTKTFTNKITKVKRKFVTNFYLPCEVGNAEVCKQMYLAVLSINESYIENTLKNVNGDGSIAEDDHCQYFNNSNNLQIKTLFGNPSQITTNFMFQQNDSDFIDCSGLLESEINESMSSKTTLCVPRRIRKKKLKPPCPSSCRNRCSEKIKEEVRRQLHKDFWCSMTWSERKKFVMDTVQEFPVMKRTGTSTLSRRSFSRKYTLPNKENRITVCQKMYFNTLSLCSKTVSMVQIWGLNEK